MRYFVKYILISPDHASPGCPLMNKRGKYSLRSTSLDIFWLTRVLDQNK